jgi:hypothetical protein
MPTVVSVSLLFRFIAFYVMGYPFEFFLSPETPRSLAVSFARPTQNHTMSSPLQITATSEIDFIRGLRPICETLFHFLILAYNTGVQAYAS